MTKKIILIGNPIAGGGAYRKIVRAVNILKEKGLDVRLMLTSKKGDALEFAKQIAFEFKDQGLKLMGSCLVIAAGGDGTYNEIANGLVYSDIPMAILPLGTTSVLAKELKIPSDIERAIDIAINSKAQTVHLGRITLIGSSKNEERLSRYFLLMAGIGFDGEAVYGVNEKIKKISGKGSYILSGLKTFLRYNPKLILIEAFEEKYKRESKEIQGYLAIICKASCYGGSFKVAPDAKLTDPHFYAFVTHSSGRFDLLRYIFGILTGRHLAFKDISYFKASEIVVKGNAYIQIDGDYVGIAPVKIEVIPNSLKLVY